MIGAGINTRVGPICRTVEDAARVLTVIAGYDPKGEQRTNETHESKTDPDARLYKKGKGKEAKLCYAGHILMENRNGLAVDGHITKATGTAERRLSYAFDWPIPKWFFTRFAVWTETSEFEINISLEINVTEFGSSSDTKFKE